MSSRKKLSSKGNKRVSAGVDQGALLRRALTWNVGPDTFANVPLHGNVTWIPRQLVMLAVLFAWSDAPKMCGAWTGNALGFGVQIKRYRRPELLCGCCLVKV